MCVEVDIPVERSRVRKTTKSQNNHTTINWEEVRGISGEKQRKISNNLPRM